MRNPIDADQPALRTSLLPSLLAARRLNQARRNRDVRLFELAHIYLPKGPGELPDERLCLGVVGDVDFRAMKGVVEALLGRFGLSSSVKWDESRLGCLSDGLDLTLDGSRIGCVGRVSQAILDRYDLKVKVAAAEVDFSRIAREAKPVTKFRELPRFPGIDRDLAIVVADGVGWAEIVKVIEERRIALIESIAFLSEFRGKSVGEGKKSIALSMVFRAIDRTLRHDEADAAQNEVLSALSAKLGATLRQ